MRADVLMLCLTVFATGCASRMPSTISSGSLHYSQSDAVRAGLGAAPNGEQPRPTADASPSTTPLEEPERLSRRRRAREVVTGASPGRSAGTVGVSVARSAAQEDAWEKLLTDAGLEERDARPLGSSLAPAQAARLLEVLLRKPVTLGTFPSRMAVGHLLREVLLGGEVSRVQLLHRVERFARVAVLRPDGYLAWTRTGRTQQKVASVEWRESAFRAGPFELGRFYVSNGFVFQLADGQLEPVEGPVFVEVHDDADYVGRTFAGAEAAFVKLVLSVGQLLTRPLDSLAALKELPAGVAALIASSPEYFERFRYMTRGEQVQAIAEMATNLLVTTGTATATTRTLTGALAGSEATVPVLTLSSQGALAIERVTASVRGAGAVLGSGPGAALLLHRANTGMQGAGPSKGPGQWGPVNESMKPPARRYQEQITGHSADEAYWVGGMRTVDGGVKFDGFKGGVLLEAKGPNYANKFLDNLDPEPWFKNSGAVDIVKQAQRQVESVRGMSIPIEWHIAEKKVADAIRRLLTNNRITEISVVHTPAL